MRHSFRPFDRFHQRRLLLLPVLFSCLLWASLSIPATHAAEEGASTDLAAQVWQYLTTQDAEQQAKSDQQDGTHLLDPDLDPEEGTAPDHT